MRIFHLLVLCLSLAAAPLWGQGREVRLYAAPELVETGLLAYVLPRFKLKTQIRVTLVGWEAAEVFLAPREGAAALIRGPGGEYAVWAEAETQAAQRLRAWLGSEIGLRTLTAYRRDGAQVVFVVEAAEAVPEPALPEGDIAAGRALALRNCGRCHVVGEENRMQGIESTPSFAVLRALADWQARFATYYQRAPHPAFTQIEGLTEPFHALLPPPIEPLALSVEEFNAIIAFVARIAPADLGAPLATR